MEGWRTCPLVPIVERLHFQSLPRPCLVSLPWNSISEWPDVERAWIWGHSSLSATCPCHWPAAVALDNSFNCSFFFKWHFFFNCRKIQERKQALADSCIDQNVVPIHQGRGFRPWSGHVQESTSECRNKWNSKSLFLSLFSFLSLSLKSMDRKKKRNKNSSQFYHLYILKSLYATRKF